MHEAGPGPKTVAGVVVSASCSGVWGGWCLSVRARLLPLGALPFRRARPQEPPACQTDLCSQMQPRRRREEERGEANVRRGPERKRLEGEKGRRGSEEEEGEGSACLAAAAIYRHALHVKHSCTETPWESVKERRAKEDDTEVSPNSNTVCQWLGDITDLRPNPVTDGYHRESQPTTNTPTHTRTHSAQSRFIHARR